MGLSTWLKQSFPVDQDMLIFDVTGHTSGDPTEADQLLVYNQIFAGYQHGYYQYDSYSVPIDKSELGQYQTIFWIDDDISREVWPADSLRVFLARRCRSGPLAPVAK